MDTISRVAGSGILLLIIIAFVGGGAYKRINVFDAFIDGAKEGFQVMVKIIPYLVGMLVGIGV
jgi:spore maturation protein SpmB